MNTFKIVIKYSKNTCLYIKKMFKEICSKIIRIFIYNVFYIQSGFIEGAWGACT